MADGKGDLAKLLTKSNFNCKIIDPVSLRHKQLDYERKYFTRDYDSEDYDLILGLHPDHATAEIILNAKRLKKKFAIVPCCVLGDEAKGVGDYFNWLKKLKHLANNQCRETNLPIKGMNRILFS